MAGTAAKNAAAEAAAERLLAEEDARAVRLILTLTSHHSPLTTHHSSLTTHNSQLALILTLTLTLTLILTLTLTRRGEASRRS